MESLYDNLIEYYDELFPIDQERLNFIVDLSTRLKPINSNKSNRIKVLDIGCATGTFSLALMRRDMDVTGIDNNAAMIQSACRRNPEPHSNARFFRMNMLDIANNMAHDCYDLVLCLGNTLVHLEDSESVLDFLEQVYEVLRTGGVFVFQVINYEKVINEELSRLPTIESARARFEREYRKRDDGRLNFDATIFSSSGQPVFRDRIPLLPIQPMELLELLRKAGFVKIDLYDDFSGDMMKGNSLAIVGVAYREE